MRQGSSLSSLRALCSYRTLDGGHNRRKSYSDTSSSLAIDEVRPTSALLSPMMLVKFTGRTEVLLSAVTFEKWPQLQFNETPRLNVERKDTH